MDKETIKFLKEHNAIKNSYGFYEYTTYAGGVTHWEYDPETDMCRHCGEEPGCFWTEWE